MSVVIGLIFENHAEDERPGACKMLVQRSRRVALCAKPTAQQQPICRECFGAADDVTRELERTWPPRKRGVETRLIFNQDDGYFGILSIGEHNQYFHANLPQPRSAWKAQRPAPQERQPVLTPQRDFHAIDIQVRLSNAWAAKDAVHGGLWSVYILRLQDGSFYVGQTRKAAEKRADEHRQGQGASVCRERGVDKLLFQTRTQSRLAALEVEAYTVQVLRRLGLRATSGNDPDG